MDANEHIAAESTNPFLVGNFTASFVEARTSGSFNRTELRDKEGELVSEWCGSAVGVAEQIPLAARGFSVICCAGQSTICLELPAMLMISSGSPPI